MYASPGFDPELTTTINRDLAKLNIMMDGEHLYPEGHHPLHPGMAQTLTQMSRHLRRRDVAKIHPVKYLFIDFQSTNYYDPIEKIYVRFGQDNDLPELHRQGLFSPFPCDIFTLGNVYSKEFLEVRPYTFNLIITKSVLSTTQTSNSWSH